MISSFSDYILVRIIIKYNSEGLVKGATLFEVSCKELHVELS